jgi:hypothetical protein
LVATLQTASSTPQLARVVAVGQTDIEALSDDERIQFAMWMYGWFRVLERGYAHYRQGFIDSGEWEGHAKNLASIMRSPAVQHWWKARRDYFGPELSAYVDGLETDSAALSIGELAGTLSNSEPSS